MTERPGLDLGARRDLGDTLTTAANLYSRYPLLFLALAFVWVLPAALLVEVIAPHDLDTDEDLGAAALAALGLAILGLVVPPLVTAGHARALVRIAAGEPVGVGPCLRDVVARLPLIVGAGIISGICIVVGFVFLVIPGIWLWVILQFSAQTAALEGARPNQALRRSANLVAGSGWRVLGYLLLTLLASGAAQGALGRGFDAAGLEGAAYRVVTETAVQTLTLSFTALVMTLLYFDLRARRDAPEAEVTAGSEA